MVIKVVYDEYTMFFLGKTKTGENEAERRRKEEERTVKARRKGRSPLKYWEHYTTGIYMHLYKLLRPRKKMYFSSGS